ncbi:MAG: flippase-like domain-containing protein [Dehalococcoidia bacterium]|nr:flippase-like domain-containing protein [Dehalococcoidia bacterium]
MTEARRRGRAAPQLAVLLMGLALLGGVAIALDWHELRRLAGDTNWWWVPPALAMTALSYLGLSAGLVACGELVGLPVRRAVMLRIAFVSIAMNHVVSLGGAAGYSVRTALIGRHGGVAGAALAMSLLHSYLNNLMLMALIQLGVLEIALDAGAPPVVRGTLLFGALVSFAFIVLSTAALFAGRLRRRCLGVLRRLARVLPAAWDARLTRIVAELEASLDLGARGVRESPRRAAPPLAFAVLDWTATLLAFWCCLAAFGERVSPQVLVAGSAIGIGAGFASLIPGGIGTQEGSLAVVFSLLGVQLEHAVLAAILFRLVYYFVPFAVSLPLYLGVTRAAERRGETARG